MVMVLLYPAHTLPIVILSSYVTSLTFLLQVKGAVYPLEHIYNPSSLKKKHSKSILVSVCLDMDYHR
jgi:hypothetical protein